MKALHKKLTASIILNGGSLEAIPLQSGMRQGNSLPLLLSNIVIVEEKEMKGIQTGKRKSSYPYLHTAQRSSKLSTKCLEMANKLNNAARYRINLHRSIDFIYLNNQQSTYEERDPFTVASRKIKISMNQLNHGSDWPIQWKEFQQGFLLLLKINAFIQYNLIMIPSPISFQILLTSYPHNESFNLLKKEICDYTRKQTFHPHGLVDLIQ